MQLSCAASFLARHSNLVTLCAVIAVRCPGNQQGPDREKAVHITRKNKSTVESKAGLRGFPLVSNLCAKICSLLVVASIFEQESV